MTIIGVIFVALGILFSIASKTFPKVRLLLGDFSVVTQYIIGFILMLIGILFLYLGGTFS